MQTQWTTDLAIDVPAVDEQHRQLIDLLTQLHQSLNEGNGEAGHLLDEFILRAHMHFAAEEAVMQYRQYPQFLAHQARHASLLEDIHHLKTNIDAGRMPLSLTLMDFLHIWLIEHIRTADRQLGKFLREGHGEEP